LRSGGASHSGEEDSRWTRQTSVTIIVVVEVDKVRIIVVVIKVVVCDA